MNKTKVLESLRDCRTIEHLNRLDTWLQDNSDGDDGLSEVALVVETILVKHKLFLYDMDLKDASSMWVGNNPYEPEIPTERDTDFRFLPDVALAEIKKAIPSEVKSFNPEAVAPSVRRLTMSGRVIRDRFRRKYCTIGNDVPEEDVVKIFKILNSHYMKGYLKN